MGDGRGRNFTPGFIPPDDCGPWEDRIKIRPDDEDDKPFDFAPGFGYNQGHPVCDLRKSVIIFTIEIDGFCQRR